MNRIQNPSLQIQNNSVLCCRACLMTDCRLYNIHEYKIVETFKRISGTEIMARDRLPQYLCAFCYMLLLKYSAFRNMCLRTQQLFKRMTADCIRKKQLPQRSLNLTKTEVEIVEALSEAGDNESNKEMLLEALNESADDEDMRVESLDDDDMPVERLDDDSETEFVPAESSNKKNENILVTMNDLLSTVGQRKADAAKNTEIKIENATADKLFTKTGKAKREILLKNLLSTSTIDQRNVDAAKNTVMGIENVSADNFFTNTGKEHGKRKRMTIGVKHNKLELKVGPRKAKTAKHIEMAVDNVGSDKNVAKTGKENKEKMKTMTIEVKNNALEFNVADGSDDDDVIVNDKKIRQKRTKHRLAATIPISNFTESDIKVFESRHNVKIAILSKEEQLEEIALRKKSRNYLESPYRCEDCGKGFGLETPYTNHRARHSPSNGANQCEICGLRLRKRWQYKIHVNRHSFKFTCNECSFISRNQLQAKLHDEMHAGKTYECQYCGKKFRKKSTYFSHVRMAHPKMNVVCDECGETFVSEMGLTCHKNLSHVVRLQCDICPAPFLTKEALNRHTELGEHSGLACEQCGDNCASEEELQKHVEGKHPSRRCEECDMTFTNSAAFDTHVQRKHMGKRWAAPARPHKQYRSERSRKSQLERLKAPCMCDKCGVTFANSGQLVYHIRKHEGVHPYSCPHCPKAFVARFHLKYHMRTHTGEKPYKCAECPLAFSLKGNLNRHNQTVHKGIRGSFPCPVCGRTSTTKASMKVHLRAVHGGEGWPKRNRPQHATTRKRPAQHSRVHPTTRNDLSDATQSDSDNSNV